MDFVNQDGFMFLFLATAVFFHFFHSDESIYCFLHLAMLERSDDVLSINRRDRVVFLCARPPLINRIIHSGCSLEDNNHMTRTHWAIDVVYAYYFWPVKLEILNSATANEKKKTQLSENIFLLTCFLLSFLIQVNYYPVHPRNTLQMET